MTSTDHEERMAAREFVTAALYMALVLWAALLALPVDRVPSNATVVGILLGTGVGLIVAHWVAFRLASHLTEPGGFRPADAA